MMNLPLPQPPTDNLYKFKAISGLLIIIAIILLIAVGFYQLLQSINDYLAKDNLLRTEIIAFWQDFNIDASGIPVTQEEVKKFLENRDNSDKTLQTNIFPNRESVEKFRVVTKDFAVREAERDNALLALKIEVFLKLALFIFFLYLLNRGFNLMQRGFDEWYNKLQKYQDLLARNQASESIKGKSKKPVDDKTN